jgi:transposase-like protein
MPSKYKSEAKHITAKSQKGQNLPAMWTEEQARAYFESRRWPNGPVCPHCESNNVYRVGGTSHRPGLFECRSCREQFTVTTQTVMEDTHLPLKVWAMAFHFMTTAKKGMSALQLQRNLGIGSYRTAWFLAHRIREAMRCEPVAGMLKGTVECDETFIGGKPRREYAGQKFKRGLGTKKAAVMALVSRDGNAVSTPIPDLKRVTLHGEMKKVIHKTATVMTDEYPTYKGIGDHFDGGHHVVNHAQGEYARDGVTTNTAESYFALLKRGHYGVYHKMSKQHLHRYCNEFDFRWSGRTLEDVERRDAAVDGAKGKRLFYKMPAGEA